MSTKRVLRSAAALAAGAALTLIPAIASQATPDSSATATRKTLNVRPQVQQEENWCWATTGLTVTQYLGHGTSKTQNDFCKAGLRFTGSRCPDQTGQMYNVQNGAAAFGAKSGYVRSTLSFSQIQQGIDANSPMPAGYYWRAGGGHMVAIVGYDSSSQEIMINDSYPTHRRQMWIRYNDFVSNNEWRWAQTIMGMAKGGSSSWATRALEEKGPVATDKQNVESTTVAVASEERSAVAQSVKADAVDSRVAALLSETKSTTVAAKDVKVEANPVQVLQLNPDFVAGRSSVVTAKDSLASLARTSSGDVAVVKFTQTEGAPRYSAVLSGDDEVRFSTMSGGGTVFREVQNGAWYRLLDGKILPLNDVATKVVGAEGKSVAEYQKIVNKKYADKMAGSLYQRLGMFGGVDH